MEEEVKKYLDTNGRRIIEDWCSLQKDTLLRQLIGFIAQEKWEVEHGYKKEAEEAEEEDLPPSEDRGSGVETDRGSGVETDRGSGVETPREREDAMDREAEVVVEAEHWVGESTGVHMTVTDIPSEPPKLVRQDAEDKPHVRTCIGKAL